MKQRVAPRAVLGAAVAATSTSRGILLLGLLLLTTNALAAILPEERTDALYHSYEGGGVKIDGPSVLVRKNVSDKFSFYGNYYVDMVTSASIDVLTQGSEYTEERTEFSVGMDYLNDRTIMSLSLTNSSESDYEANTLGLSISQEFFGDLSTLTMGFSLGDDTVKSSEIENFEADAERRRFNLGFSQILSPKFIASFTYESVIDEGFLRNPYRRIRAIPVGAPAGSNAAFITPDEKNTLGLCGTQPAESNIAGAECYPETRNSESFALRGVYALTPTSSIRAEYRIFEDSWDIEANNIELRYTRQFGSRWLLELRYREYDQTEGAFFYSDLFDFNQGLPTFFGRDKELSVFSSEQFGIGITYTFKSRNAFFNDSKLSFQWDTFSFTYDDFLDATNDDFADGSEPSYSLDADVIRLFYSVYF